MAPGFLETELLPIEGPLEEGREISNDHVHLLIFLKTDQ